MRVENLETLDKQYSIVYADPPWIQKKGGKKNVRPNSSGGGIRISNDYNGRDRSNIAESENKQ